MKDNDISIKRRALDLVYIIINTNNIKQIIKECLNFLIVAEPEIKFELTTKVKLFINLAYSITRKVFSLFEMANRYCNKDAMFGR